MAGRPGDAYSAGAHGCLLKDTSEMDLVAALRDVVALLAEGRSNG